MEKALPIFVDDIKFRIFAESLITPERDYESVIGLVGHTLDVWPASRREYVIRGSELTDVEIAIETFVTPYLSVFSESIAAQLLPRIDALQATFDTMATQVQAITKQFGSELAAASEAAPLERQALVEKISAEVAAALAATRTG